MVRWCKSSKKDLILPLNKLEKTKDKKRIWRSRVNKELERNIKKYLN